MKKLFFFFILSSLLIISSSYQVMATASISLPEGRSVAPGESKSWSFYVSGSPHIMVNIEGSLVEYATLDDPNPGGGARTVVVTWSVPEDIVPGHYEMYVRATEEAPKGSMLGAVASVRARLSTTKIADYPYITADFEPGNQNTGEKNKAKISLQSISSVKTKNIVLHYTVEGISSDINLGDLEPMEKRDEIVDLDTEKLRPGVYDTDAKITYDSGEPISFNKQFRVGSLNFVLKSAPNEITRGLNKLKITIGSEWNTPVTVEPVMVIPELGVKSEKMEGNIPGFSRREMTTYIEIPEDAEMKEYDAEVRFSIEGKDFVLPFKTNLIENKGEIVREEVAPKSESPGLLSSPLVLAYLAVIILVIINIILLLRQQRR